MFEPVSQENAWNFINIFVTQVKFTRGIVSWYRTTRKALVTQSHLPTLAN